MEVASWPAYLAGIPVGIVDTGIVTLIQPLQHCVCVKGERGKSGTFNAFGFNVQCIDAT